MPDLFESEVGAIHVACSECGAPLELASSALSVFGSQDAVRCMDCLLRTGADASTDVVVPLPERIRMIDEAVALGGIDYFVVACPKDVTMYEDAIKTSGHQGEIKLREISELVLEALDLTPESGAGSESEEDAK